MRVLGTALIVIACSGCSGSGFRPVVVGQNEGVDACDGIGQVQGSRQELTSVRSGPGANFREVDQVAAGQFVYICDGNDEWTGVVYVKGSEMTPDCGVTSPVPQSQPYAGACQSGWILASKIIGIAG